MKSKDAETWDELLGEDVVFYSPVVLPQKGKKITMMYLMAATSVFGSADVDSESTRDAKIESKFRYVNEIIGENLMVLEFGDRRNLH